MRWDNLFDDLESQLESELTAEEVDLHAEEERLRLGRLSLRDRIVSLHDAHDKDAAYSIRLVFIGEQRLDVRPAAFGRDWFSADIVDDSARRQQCIVPLSAIALVQLTLPQVSESLAKRPRDEESRVLSSRLGLPFVLRDLCRRRKALDVQTTAGRSYGTIDRVGRDHFDLAVHEPDKARRNSAVSGYQIVMFAELLLVRL
jgi:hypothetical protein